MKRKLLLFTLAVLAFVLGGCAETFKPAPIGDTLIWSNESARPGWTVNPPEIDDGDAYVFIGQSLYHGTERAAKTNAEVNASSKAATYLAHELKRQYLEKTSGTGTEGSVLNSGVNINETVELTADRALNKMTTEKVYIEQWQKGSETFWNVYVLTKLPKPRL